MKITGLAKSDADRTFLRDDTRDGRVLTNGYNRERRTINAREVERSDSGCGGRCVDHTRKKVSLAACTSNMEGIAYVTAV